MLNSIQSELDSVNHLVEKRYRLKAGPLSRFIPEMELNNTDRWLYPALVILSGRLFRGNREKIRVLAAVIHFIIAAQTVHNRIPDDCPKELPQFPVLGGDYLFSTYFKLLSDHDMLEWLAPLAKVICEMNEGGILRMEVIDQGKGTEEDYLDVIRQEHGLLTAHAARIGAEAAGADHHILDALEQFGLNLGIAWGIIKTSAPLSPAPYLAQAREHLAVLPAGPERDTLNSIVEIVGSGL